MYSDKDFQTFWFRYKTEGGATWNFKYFVLVVIAV